jgi:2-dehydro-3-deoxyphosphogluconate aldolase / (4S)-4-hydroxy-2-oxoglutarate aldolase
MVNRDCLLSKRRGILKIYCMNILSQILHYKIVAILRGAQPKEVFSIVEALFKGGIRLVEITLNSENALVLINEISTKMRDKMLIGAGTVLDLASAEAAISSGAQFIISPSLNVEVIKYVRQKNLVVIPGAYTATEILTAFNAGADIVKVFPAGSPQYIKDLRGPLSHIPLMPTGGINILNIREFQKAGAVAFGVGSSLVNPDMQITDSSLQQLAVQANQFVLSLNKNLDKNEKKSH